MTAIGVDPKTRVLLDMIAALGAPPLSETTPQQFREMRARSRDLLNAPTAPVAIVRDETVEGGAGPIKARLYDVEDGATRPTLVYFHGGGFVFGDLDSHDALCRRLALAVRIRVFAVDYGLAPEDPFPAAPDDAWAAFNDIAARFQRFGVDPRRMALGGDSAGANLATVTARRAAQAGAPLVRFQLLFYPVTQSSHSTPSRELYADGYFLTRETIDWFDGHYLPAEVDRRDERISPLLTPPPANLAPALVVTAGFDPLKDEGRAYAEALEAAGVPVRHVDYPDQIHGFASFTAFSSVADQAIADAARAVAEALG
ncbi:MAG: alpha/beta hydrolase [Parvularculaceae bacterium]|nr:alpha/beta hydrolase [Parvularculaceae bacterium]